MFLSQAASSAAVHQTLVYVELALAAITVIATLLVQAPYGRHVRAGWGPTMPALWGWVVMESPSVLVFAAVFAYGQNRSALVPLFLLALWQWHYLQRTFVFPFRMRGSKKRVPLVICGLAVVFNCLNSYINARWISHFGRYDADWLKHPCFLAGLSLFAAGWYINVRADSILRDLRSNGESGYSIPRGWLYRWISCPNYLGEMLEWFGWALLTYSLAGLAFALYTVANLAPRALSNHRWYRQRFEDYPSDRKALIPGLL